MLKIEHLTKKYGKIFANLDISFEIPDSSITVLLGPNGAGKSTLIKSVIGFLKYDGIITVDGHYNKSLDAKRLLGYIPELPALYPNLTVGEHMEFVARAYKLKDYKEYKNELLQRFELSDKVKKFGDELSKGMQQKLSICCALLPKPKVMLFDEPMIGLDPHSIKELKDLFVDMKNQGCSILISTHMIDSIDMLWDRTLIMQGGVLKADVTRQQLEESNETLEQLFFRTTEGSMEE